MRNFDFVGNQILLRILLVSVISFLVVSLGAQNLKAAPFTGNYLWSLEGQQVEEQDVLSSSTLTSFSVVANLKNKLTNNFFLHFSPGVFFTSARAQDLVLYKRPSNSFFANQAKMSFRPLYALQLQAGAINQGFLKNSQLVSGRAFPSAKLKLRMLPKEWKSQIFLEAQQAIPTSYTFSTEAQDEEETPSLRTYGFGYRFMPVREFKVSLGGYYYEYSNLPQVVAVESELLGNTVNKFSSQTAAFEYDFKGLSGYGSVDLKLGSFDATVGGTFIQNTEALDGLNQGYSIFGSGKIHLASDSLVGMSVTHFRVEPDTSPGYYNSSTQPNNRLGFSYKLFYRFKKSNFQINGKFSTMTPIYEDDLMGERSIFLLSVESLGASI